ncbi:MAG: glucokinase [Candidatus Eisenbacteria bacterium]
METRPALTLFGRFGYDAAVILAGDVGGTKTQLALIEPGGSARTPAARQRYASRDHSSLETLVAAFVAEHGARPTRAVIGIAGPVMDNACETTNLPWSMSGDRLSETLSGTPVTLLNDLVTTAWGLGELGPGDLAVLQPGLPTRGNRALIAAGTGLGEALLVRDGERWVPSASEGGHTDFASRNEFEDGLLRWLRTRYRRVSYERVVSGPGLADLYRYHREVRVGEESAEFAETFDRAADPAAVVTEAALDGRCERAHLTLERFCEIYGAEAGNLALKTLALGGVYLAGGIAPKIAPALRAGGFLQAFTSKGRLTPVLERIPVSIILDEHTSLWGAARVALDGAR